MFRIGDNKLLRQFLLQSLKNQAKLKEIENALLFDPAFAQQVMLAEDELIEDYLDDDLTYAEQRLFVRNFLVSAERRENFKFLRLLMKYARKTGQETLEG